MNDDLGCLIITVPGYSNMFLNFLFFSFTTESHKKIYSFLKVALIGLTAAETFLGIK